MNACQKRLSRGSALITALALVAITSLMLSGVCVLSTSHATRQRREADYALAMQMAEAGVNYEVRYMAANGSGHTSSSPCYNKVSSAIPACQASASAVGASNYFSVYTDTTNKIIYATGTAGATTSPSLSGGIQRTVALNYASSVFDGAYAAFATKSISVNRASMSGKIGCNTSSITLAQTGATTCPNRTDSYDTVDTCVSKCFTHGWSDLNSSAAISDQCSRMHQFTFWGYWTNSVSSSNCSAANWPTSGSSAINLNDNQCSNYYGNTLILSPGDYYFNACSLTSNTRLICDNADSCNGGAHPGPCRIWIGGQTSNNSDQMTCNIDCTSTDPACAPRCYYGKTTDTSGRACGFTVGGQCRNVAHTTTCNRGTYAVCQGKNGTGTCPTLNLHSSYNCKGNCIGDIVTANSTTTTTAKPMIHPSDPSRPDTLNSSKWQEIAAPNASKVFTDGTNY